MNSLFKKIATMLLVLGLAFAIPGTMLLSFADESGTTPTENLTIEADTDIVMIGNAETNGVTTEKVYYEGFGRNPYKGFNFSSDKFWNKETLGDNVAVAAVACFETPVKAEYYETLRISFHTGVATDFYFFASTQKEFTKETAKGSVSASAFTTPQVTLSVSDFADENGYVNNITMVAFELPDEGYQVFIGRYEFALKQDEDVEPEGDLDLKTDSDDSVTDFIVASKLNPNGVTTEDVVFDGLQPTTWTGASDLGYWLCTKTMMGKPLADDGKTRNAVVLTFKNPLSAKWYDKFTFTFYSGVKADLEFYNSDTKDLVSANAKYKLSAADLVIYSENTVKLKASDFASFDGKIHNITIKVTGNVEQEGQLFFGKMSFGKKTETSYLDEFVITEGAAASLVATGDATFITENIPAATEDKGAFDSSAALMITGNASLTFKKVINQVETDCGNITLRLYRAASSSVTALVIGKNGEEGESYDISDKTGWFDLVLGVNDFTDGEGNIAGMDIKLVGDGEIIFAGAEVEDKLRVYDEKYSTADISEVIPMGENGLSFTSTDAAAAYVPVFERTDMKKNAVKFRLRVSDLTSDFNVMFTLAGAGETTNGMWFWFDKHGVNAKGISSIAYPAGVESDKWMDVEIGAVPYTVNFLPYGVRAYMKVNGETMLERNLDKTEQETGTWFSMYVHATSVGVKVDVASQTSESYVKTEVVSLVTESGKTEYKVGDSDRIRVVENLKLNGMTVSKISVVSGDSVTVDEYGFIEAEKKGETVLKVTYTAAGVIEGGEVTVKLTVTNTHTVKIGDNVQQVEDGEKLVLPELKKDGYEFTGLYLDAECTQKFDYATTPVTKDLTLYVGWTAVKKKGGCGGAVSGISLAGAAIFAGLMIIKKKKS